MKKFFTTKYLHPELTSNVSRHNNLAVFATICGTIFILQDLYTLAPSSTLAIWAICQILISVFRLLLGYKLFTCKEANSEWSLVTWLFILSITLSGLVMGYAAVIAELYGTVEQQLFVFAILIGFTGGAVATLSPVIQACITYVVGILVPQVVVLFFQIGEVGMFDSPPLEKLMGYLSLLYLIIIIRASVILYETFYESIMLKNQLAEAKELAETANQAKSKFLSSVSHELRTPLHAIMGSTQLLEMDNQDAEAKKQFFGLIKQAGTHLLTLIDQILEFAKIEAGKIKLDVADLELNPLLDECEELMQTAAANKDISLSVTRPEKPHVFPSDRLRLKQILLNLLSNAIKYNRKGGEVAVSVADLDSKRLRISVRDNGYGIPQERQEEMFESFNRLGRESGEQEGTGIGLVICKELITLMGGTIGFKSEENQGSEFWIDVNTRYFEDRTEKA